MGDSKAKEAELLQAVDHSRWLLNNGLANDVIKNQLFAYGGIAHPNILAVDLALDMENKCVKYDLFVDTKLLKKIKKFKELSESEGFWGLRKFKKMLIKEGNLHLDNILDNFIKDYCGRQWRTEIRILDYAEFVDSNEDVEDESVNFGHGKN